ncbi:hypothetical protein NL676_027825 [Syzygium grande]|nr:hypothetical protein NL676_027825 [Syzygium grande]
MQESQGRGGARGKVPCTAEAAKTWTAADGTGARPGAKRGGVIPAERRLVKRMMWDRAVNWVSFACGSCFGSSATRSEPVRAKKTAVGVAEILPLPGKH